MDKQIIVHIDIAVARYDFVIEQGRCVQQPHISENASLPSFIGWSPSKLSRFWRKRGATVLWCAADGSLLRSLGEQLDLKGNS